MYNVSIMNKLCKYDHELTESNIYIYTNKLGITTTHCRICRREADKRHYNGEAHLKRGPKQRTHCKYGHELNDANTYQTYKNGKKTGRKCRTCERRLQRSYATRNPEIMYRTRINSQLNRKYRIKNNEHRDSIFALQGGKCAICGTTDNVWDKGFQKVWHIDHEHNGRPNYRGIIC